jgi:hypothetical protein
MVSPKVKKSRLSAVVRAPRMPSRYRSYSADSPCELPE